jgi:hypothetical protein
MQSQTGFEGPDHPVFGPSFVEEQGMRASVLENGAKSWIRWAPSGRAAGDLPVIATNLPEFPCYQGREGLAPNCVAHHSQGWSPL